MSDRMGLATRPKVTLLSMTIPIGMFVGLIGVCRRLPTGLHQANPEILEKLSFGPLGLDIRLVTHERPEVGQLSDECVIGLAIIRPPLDVIRHGLGHPLPPAHYGGAR